MAATSIEFRATDGGTPSPYVPLDGTMKFRAIPNGYVAKYRWLATGGLRIVEGGASQTVKVRGERASLLVGDSTLRVTVDNGRFTSTLELTVVSIDRLVAVVESTPATDANTAREALGLLRQPAAMEFPSTNTAEVFSSASSLVLIGGQFPDVTVRAEVRPEGVPIVWSSVRSPGDGEGPEGLTLSTTEGSETRFKTDKTGAYFVNAQVAVRPGIPLARAMLKRLPVVLVGVTGVTDNTTYAQQGFSPSTELERLSFASKGFQRDQNQSRTFMYASGEDFINYDAEVQLGSGGGDGRLFLDKVRAAWIQTARGAASAGGELRGNYESSSATGTGLVASLFPIGRNSVFDVEVVDPLSFPVPDAPDGERPPIVANAECRKANAAKGQVWRLTGNDLPNATVPTYFGGGDGGGDPLTQVDLDMRFTAYVCLWTEAAPAVFGVAYKIDWGLSGKWSIDSIVPLIAVPTVAPEVSHSGLELDPQAADLAGAEVLGPGTVQHLVLIQDSSPGS